MTLRSWWNKFYDVHWVEVGIGSLGLWMTAIMVVAVPGISEARLQAFFETGAQVNAAFLLAVFVLVSFMLPPLEPSEKQSYASFFFTATLVFFVGLVSAGWGILQPQSGLNAQVAVGAILVSWWLGLVMLTDALRRIEAARSGRGRRIPPR